MHPESSRADTHRQPMGAAGRCWALSSGLVVAGSGLVWYAAVRVDVSGVCDLASLDGMTEAMHIIASMAMRRKSTFLKGRRELDTGGSGVDDSRSDAGGCVVCDVDTSCA